MEAYIITLLSLNLIGHAVDVTKEKRMFQEMQTPISIALENRHHTNLTRKSTSNLIAQLSSDRSRWLFRYKHVEDTGAGEILGYNEKLAKDGILKNRAENELLDDYKKRIEKQRQDLITYCKAKLERNIETGRIATVGFGAAEAIMQRMNEQYREHDNQMAAFYQDATKKWLQQQPSLKSADSRFNEDEEDDFFDDSTPATQHPVRADQTDADFEDSIKSYNPLKRTICILL